MDPGSALLLFLACCSAQALRGHLGGRHDYGGTAGWDEDALSTQDLVAHKPRMLARLVVQSKMTIARAAQIPTRYWARKQQKKEEARLRQASATYAYAELAFAHGEPAGCPARCKGLLCSRAPGHEGYHAAILKYDRETFSEYTWAQ